MTRGLRLSAERLLPAVIVTTSLALGALTAVRGIPVLLAVLGVVYATSLVAKPQIVFPLTVGLMPVVEQLSGAGVSASVAGVSVSPQLVVRLVVLAYMAFFLVAHLAELPGWRFLGTGAVLIGFAVASSVFHGLALDDVTAVSKIGYWLLMIPFTALLMSRFPNSRRLLAVAALWGAIAGGASVFLSKTGLLPERYSRYGLGESYGLFANPHSAALSLAMALFLAALVYTGSRHRKVAVAAGVVAVAGSLLTLVRTGAVAMIVGLSFIGLASLRRRYRQARGSSGRVVPLSVALVLAGGVTVASLGSAWLMRWTDFERLDTAGAGRPAIYRAAVGVFEARDLAGQVLGSGFGQTALDMSSRIGAAIGAHNDALDALLGWGLLGSVLLLATYVLVVAEALKESPVRDRPVLLGAIAAYVAGAMVNGMIFNVSAMTYLSVILGIAIAGGLEGSREDATGSAHADSGDAA